MSLAIGTYLVFVALLIGSFINLAADRLPRGESLLWPRSHCRACGRDLNAIDLLPILGYLVRGGRCATCRASIGAAAPMVEAVAGALMLGPIVWLGVWPGAALGASLLVAWGIAATTRAWRLFEREQAG